MKIIAAPWTAPAWMKTSNRLNGGTLKDGLLYANAYARYITHFVQDYSQQGVPISAVTVENEPGNNTSCYPSMKLSPAQQASIIRPLHALLQLAGMRTQILGLDWNWNNWQTDHWSDLLASQAGEDLAGVAFHCYNGSQPSDTLPLAQRYPYTPFYETECTPTAAPSDFGQPGDHSRSATFGQDLINNTRTDVVRALRDGSRSVSLFNIALDAAYEPTINVNCLPTATAHPTQRPCLGLVSVAANGRVNRQVGYYVLGQASRFVHPGARRIFSTQYGQLESVAFRNPNGQIVLLVVNSGKATSFKVDWGGQGFNTQIPASAVQTYVWDRPSPVSWSVPATLPATFGGPYSYGNWETAISCGSPTLCAAVDNAGYAVISNGPFTNGWARKLIDPELGAYNEPCSPDALCFGGAASGLNAVTCSTGSFCVAADAAGNVVWSDDPTGSGPWHVAAIDPDGRGIIAIACAGTSLCIAGDNAGNLLTTTDPAGGDWRVTATFGGSSDRVVGAACPSVHQCYIAEARREIASASTTILTSTDPQGPPSTWSAVAYSDEEVLGLSCPTTHLCAFNTDNGEVGSSTTPAMPGSWTTVWATSAGGLSYYPPGSGIACAASGSCAFGGQGFDVWTAADPTGTWTDRDDVDGNTNLITALYCADQFGCVGADANGGVVQATSPTAHWSGGMVDRDSEVRALSCTQGATCIAFGSQGGALATTDASKSPAQWTATSLSDNELPRASSCAPSGPCAVLNYAGTIFAAPSATSSIWTSASISGDDRLTGISCASTTLCVAVGGDGLLATATNPAGGTSAWRTATIDTASLTAVSCPTASLCVGVDSQGRVLTSTNPAGGSSSWTAPAAIDPGGDLSSVSCPTTGFCVAVDNEGRVLVSVGPASGPTSWTPPEGVASDDEGLNGVSCAADGLCAALTYNGKILETADAHAGAASWSAAAAPDIDGGISSVGCFSGDRCIAVDHDGGAVVGIAGSARRAQVRTSDPAAALDFQAPDPTGETPTVERQRRTAAASPARRQRDAGAAPLSTTAAVALTGAATASVSGQVAAGGQTTQVLVRYDVASSAWCDSGGSSGPFAHATAAVSLPDSDSDFHDVSVPLTGLTPGSTYCAVLVASNSSGESDPDAPVTFVAGDPTAATDDAVTTGANAVTVDGTVDPAGQATTYAVEYDLATSSWCTSTGTTGAAGSTSPVAAVTGVGGTDVSVALAGLQAGQAYCVRIVAHNGSGSAAGATTEVTPGVPRARTVDAVASGATTATVEGTVDGLGQPTHYAVGYDIATSDWCQDVPGADPASTTAAQALAGGDGARDVAIALTGLKAGSSYCARVIATNAASTTTGSGAVFAAGAPRAATLTARGSSDTTATVTGSVDPAGQATTYVAQAAALTSTWCTTAGSSGAPSVTTTARDLTDTSDGAQDVAVDLTGLTPGAYYCTQLVATNASGQAAGGVVDVDPATPVAVSGTGASTNATTAVVSGTIDPAGQRTTYAVEYDAADSAWCVGAYGGPAHTTPSATLADADGADHAVTAALAGLQSGTTYCAQLVAHNASGDSEGGWVDFEAGQPVVSTAGAVATGARTATVRGTVNPMGQSASYYVLYDVAGSDFCTGASDSAQHSTSAVTLPFTDVADHAVSVDLTDLDAGKTYCAELVAYAGSASGRGGPMQFVAGLPSAETDAATSITVTTATLNGVVDPDESSGAVSQFAWARSDDEWCQNGAKSGTPNLTPATPAPGYSSVSARIDGLTPSTDYCFAAMATSAAGTATGALLTFTTRPPQHTVTVAVTGSGTVTDGSGRIYCPPTCSAATDSPLTLTARPTWGATFTGWSGGGCGSGATCTIPMDADTSISAAFTDAPTSTPPTGSATGEHPSVTSSTTTTHPSTNDTADDDGAATPPRCTIAARVSTSSGSIAVTLRCSHLARGTLSAKIVSKRSGHRKSKTVTLAKWSVSVSGSRARTVTVRLPRPVLTAWRKGTSETATVTFEPVGGTRRSATVHLPSRG